MNYDFIVDTKNNINNQYQLTVTPCMPHFSLQRSGGEEFVEIGHLKLVTQRPLRQHTIPVGGGVQGDSQMECHLGNGR